jgi:hypothetical protein
MIIAHFKNTPIAWAPEAVCKVINKYTDHYSFVFGFQSTRKITADTDLVHHHNKVGPLHTNSNIIQYHSEPFRTAWNVPMRRLVIAQWPALFDEFSTCKLVRNPIDLFSDEFIPKYFEDKIRIGYSPSINNQNSMWHDKGFSETVAILNYISGKYKDKVEIDIIFGVSLSECLQRKSICNIFIDEVVTDSYHRSGLESLAMGIATICSVGENIEKIMLNCSGAKTIPFINVRMCELSACLAKLIEMGLPSLLEIGINARVWMERYWHPETIANEYITYYDYFMEKRIEKCREIN